ncbi:hypothetical protein ACFZBM_27055 [Streptomyces lavendulae]|uniref:hypothetical protein n=1 Tax=Streptomyces lavendulae TaxID=1914 RepID=UPI0033FDAC12
MTESYVAFIDPATLSLRRIGINAGQGYEIIATSLNLMQRQAALSLQWMRVNAIGGAPGRIVASVA